MQVSDVRQDTVRMAPLRVTAFGVRRRSGNPDAVPGGGAHPGRIAGGCGDGREIHVSFLPNDGEAHARDSPACRFPAHRDRVVARDDPNAVGHAVDVVIHAHVRLDDGLVRAGERHDDRPRQVLRAVESGKEALPAFDQLIRGQPLGAAAEEGRVVDLHFVRERRPHPGPVQRVDGEQHARD